MPRDLICPICHSQENRSQVVAKSAESIGYYRLRVRLLLKFRFRVKFLIIAFRRSILNLWVDLGKTFRSFCHSSVLGSHYGDLAKAFLADKFWRWKLCQSGDSAAPYLEFLPLYVALFNILGKNKTNILPKLNPRSSDRVNYLWRDTEIKKFDT
jgi:hypothetical protein